jgi:hypothetical protein
MQEVVLKIPAEAEGVLIATLRDAKGKPLAERLIYRQPAKSINVEVVFDHDAYIPSAPAKLKVKTTDADGKPISAVVGLTVTDDSVLEMIEKREQAPRLPVMVFLENDVRELADAHVYLDAANPKAPLAVDLLLGTQGWRRFAFVETSKFLAAHGDPARRVLALAMTTRKERVLAERLQRLLGAPGGRRGGKPGEGRPQVFDDGPAPPAPKAAPGKKVAENKQKAGKLDDAKAEGKPQAAKEPRQLRDLRKALEAADEKQNNGIAAKADRAFKRRAFRPVIMIREYAHQVRKNRKPNDRLDFTETLYWSPGVKTDPKTGEATVAFVMNDAVTSFRVLADAFSAGGVLGQGTTIVESVEPFYTEPKLPLEVTSGDVIQLPLGIVNSTPNELSAATIRATAKGLQIGSLSPFNLPGRARERRIVTVDTTGFSGQTDFVLEATAGPFSDRVTRKLLVQPLGFPVEIAHGGMLYANDTRKHEIVIPDHLIAGSLATDVKVFPSPMANMTAALERLIREPNGCFEQTSSSTYPLVMAQQ